MDQFLAEYYGTNANLGATQDADELEKMAQLVMLDKMAADEGIDLSGLNDQQVLALANEVFSGQQTAIEQRQPTVSDLEKEAAAKIEEADYLGKVMAHSMWNELDSIQKQASSGGATLQNFLGGEEGGKTVIGKGPGLKARAEGASKALKGAASAVSGAAKSVGKGAWKHKGKVGLGVGGAALLAGGGLAARHYLKKDKKSEGESEKTSSAFESLADARAYEILQANGLADDQGNVVTPDRLYGQEKTAADVLQENVEQAAMQRLADMGYRFE
jgi:hypothetical protein